MHNDVVGLIIQKIKNEKTKKIELNTF